MLRLDFFVDGHFTERYENLGFYSADFIELASRFAVDRSEVMGLIAAYSEKTSAVEEAVASSHLSSAARSRYLETFQVRLRAILQ